MNTTIESVARTTRGELLRMRTWPAVWVTVGAWIALALMFGYLFGYLSYKTGDSSFATEGQTKQALLAELMPASIPDVLVQGTPMFGGALMMVLGAIVAGNGFGWGTWKTLFTQGPSRTSTVVGSLVALTVFVVVTVAATLVLYAGVSSLIAVTESRDVVWPAIGDLSRGVGGATLVLEMWALAGFALGTIARGPALSVGLGLVWALVIENLLRGVGELLGPVEALTKIMPGTAAGSLVNSLLSMPTDTPGVVDALSGQRALVTVAVYTIALPLIAVVLVRRRDIS